MRFFWILIIATIISVIFYSVSSEGLETIISLLIVDFIALWFSTELGKEVSEKTDLAKKIENLEKLTYDLFNKITEKNINSKEKNDLTEWLNKF